MNIITSLKEFLQSIQFYRWYEILIAVVSAFSAEMLFSLLLKSRRDPDENRKKIVKELKKAAEDDEVDWETDTFKYRIGFERKRLKDGEEPPQKQHVLIAPYWDVDDLKEMCQEEDEAVDRRLVFRIWKAYHPRTARIQRIALSLRGREDDQDRVYKRDKKLFIASIFGSILSYFVLYALFLFLASLVYSGAKYGTTELISHGWSRFTYLFREYRWSMVAIPVAVKVLTTVAGERRKRWKVIISIILFIILVGASALVSYPSGSSSMESLILDQFRSMPFPYVTKFYQPDEYWGNAKTWIEEDIDEGREPAEEKPLPDGNTDGLTFIQLVDNGLECWNRDQDLAAIYFNAAYDMFMAKSGLVNTGTAITASNGSTPTIVVNDDYPAFKVGMMWYYKGSLDEADYEFALGGTAFSYDKNWLNAARCYRSAYTINYTDQYAIDAVEMYHSIENPNQDEINEIGRFLCQMQSHFSADVPYLDELCDRYPDDEVINTVKMMRRIASGQVYENARSFIDRFREEGNTKVAVVEDYYRLLNGESANDITIDEYPDDYLYYPEDLVNFGWIAYMQGNYGLAARYATAAKIEDEIIPDAYLLIAEILLQDKDLIGGNGRNLIARLQEEDLSFYDQDSKTRFAIDAVLLANRYGVKLESSDIYSLASELFDGENTGDMLIRARAAFDSAEYERCCDICDELRAKELKDAELHEVLFIEADALVEMANDAGDEGEEFLKLALELMREVESDTRNDYVECLKKMHRIYDLLDDEKNRDEVGKILQAFE